MAHIHLEDGSFYLTWAIVWSVAAIAIIALCLLWVRKVKKADNRVIIIASMLTAASFAVFQMEIPPFGVHLSLTPLIGMLAGPAVGGIIILIVNIFSAAIGHEGWSIIGSNVVLNMVEVCGGYLAYKCLNRMKVRALYSAGIATFAGLFLGNVAMVVIVMISGIQGKEVVISDLAVVITANLLMAAIEAFVTGYIVEYIREVRPDMLGIVKKTDS